MNGFEKAQKGGAKVIAVFGAASEAFSQKNINCSIVKSVERFRQIIVAAQKKDIWGQGYISCVLGCSYQAVGPVEDVVKLAHQMYKMGCHKNFSL